MPVGDHEKTLIFQTDSGICGDGKEFSKYKNYDYCGAPWNFEIDEIRSIKNKVGNGGFSIRDTAIAKNIFVNMVRTDSKRGCIIFKMV